MIELHDALARESGVVTPLVSDYRSQMLAALANLDAWSSPTLPTDEAGYLALSAIRGQITGLSCFTSNTSHPEDKRVWELESVYGRLQAQYNKRLELRPGIDRTLARYLLNGGYFTGVPTATCLLEARDRGLLRKAARQDGSHALYVVGITGKVGDNVFRVDRRGREHRQFCRTVGRQAISLMQRVPFKGDELAAFLATVSDLPDGYHETSVHDGKNCIRPIRLTQREQSAVHELLIGSEYTANPRISHASVPPASAKPPPDSGADAIALQLGLFGKAA